MMRKTISVILISVISILGYSQNQQFSEGYKAGYKEGYCFDKTVGCISKTPPVTPIPPIGKNTYRDGYNIGFTKGRADAPSINSANSTLIPNNNSNNTYEKYRDANRYQSGGASEQRMVGDAVDAAIEENRMRRQRASQSNQYQGSSNYSSYTYTPQTTAEFDADQLEQSKDPSWRKRNLRWDKKFFLKKYLKYKKRYGVDHPDFENWYLYRKNYGFILQDGKLIDIGYQEGWQARWEQIKPPDL